jgi:membrane protein YqaA with SNARE-associated domain
MGDFVQKIRGFALALGAPGLFLVTFLDSSVLSLPEIADLLVVYMVVAHKPRLVVYVTAATLGSVAGCVFLYLLARKGEEALVKRRMTSPVVERAFARLKRWGPMAVLIPSLLPPPVPFKVFVLLAGAAGITLPQFTLAVTIGRGLRYAALGLLAFRYGDSAIDFLHQHAIPASLIGIAVVLAGAGAYVIWTRAHALKRR